MTTDTTYEPGAGEHIDQTAAAIVALANETGQSVVARFNGEELHAEPGGDAAAIAAGYQARMSERSAAFHASPEGQRQIAEAEERAKIAAQAAADGILPFQRRDAEAEEAWERTVAANQDFYGSGILRYAARWAAWMEQRMRDGATVAEAAGATQGPADLEGVSGFMESVARRILESVWLYGEALEAWQQAPPTVSPHVVDEALALIRAGREQEP